MKRFVACLVLLLPVTLCADVNLCTLRIGSGVVPVSNTRAAHQCLRHALRIKRQLQRLCGQAGGTEICVRLLADPLVWTAPCGAPIPTLAECCAAHAPLLLPDTTCPPATCIPAGSAGSSTAGSAPPP